MEIPDNWFQPDACSLIATARVHNGGIVEYNTITKIYTNTNETNMLKTNTYQNSERKTGNPNDNWFQPGSLITTARVPWRLVIKSRGFQTLW